MAIAAVIIGLIALEARFGFLTAIFNKFRRAFSFIPGISAPDDDEDERRAPRGRSAGGTQRAQPRDLGQGQEEDERTIIERRLTSLQYRRTSIGISVEGQQEIDDLEQRLASLPRRERPVEVQVAGTAQQPAQPNVAQQRGFVQAPQRQDELTDIERRLSSLRSRRATVGVTVEGQQEIDQLDKACQSLTHIDRRGHSRSWW